MPLRQLEQLCTSDTTFGALEALGARAASGDVDPRAVVHLSSTESLAHLAAPLRELLAGETR